MSRILARVHRLLSLPAAEILVALRAAAMASLIWLALRILSLPRLLALLDPGVARRGGDADAGNRVPPERLVELVSALLGRRRSNLGPWKAGCLSRSLVLFRLLRQAGCPVVVRFGVAKEGDAISGHCWLEHNGAAVAEEADPRQAFRAIYSYPADASPESAMNSL